MEYQGLEPGYEFPPVSYELTPSIVSKYQAAVEAHPSVPGLVPPLAIAAYTFKTIFESVSLPPGSIHAAQEIELLKPVAIGSTINCQVRVIKKISRGKLNMLVIGLSTFDQDGQLALSGKATLVLPSSNL